MSEERKKFSKCGEGERKCKCRISGVRKKENWKKEKFREKKIKVFFFLGWKFLLSSCSLVGFYCERGMFFKFEEKRKILGVCYPVSWASCWLKCSIIWANWKVKIAVTERKKIRDFCSLGLYPLVGCKKMIACYGKVWWKEREKKNLKYFSGRGLCVTHVGASCCETWLKFKVLNFRCSKKEVKVKKKCSGHELPR